MPMGRLSICLGNGGLATGPTISINFRESDMQQPRFVRIAGYVTFAVILSALGLMVGESIRESRAGQEKSDPPRTQPPDKSQNGGQVAYVGARIHTAAGPVIANGVMIVQGGKIVAIGPQ